MAAHIPSTHLDLVHGKAFAHLATLMPDGRPQVTPVWVDFDGEYVMVNSAKGRIKDRNMEQRPMVALSIQDPHNPYRYLSIQGQVVDIVEEGDGARDHINSLSRRYTGREIYQGRFPDEKRRIYKIVTEKVFAAG